MSARLTLLLAVFSLPALAQGEVQVQGKDGATVKTGPGGVEVTGKGGKKVKLGGANAAVQAESGTKKVEVGTTGAAVKAKSGDAQVEVGAGGTGPAPVATAEVLQVTGQGRQLNHACAPNQDVQINGQGHQVTLTGPCRRVQVNGQGSTVTVDAAEALEVNGMSNAVTWKAGVSGPRPKISVGGLSNSVTQAK